MAAKSLAVEERGFTSAADVNSFQSAVAILYVVRYSSISCFVSTCSLIIGALI
jgi:hypothetical protein